MVFVSNIIYGREKNAHKTLMEYPEKRTESRIHQHS
jgi:hypothetical protein